jgi:predicted Ser/Thr protein kinase
VSAYVGRSLGRYRLEELLGQGGMAEVHRATDTKLARTVAVKVILATHAIKGEFLERFLREARMVASLEHPNILPVYDFGEDNGVPFLVMPYLPGGTLRERLKAGATPPALASAWIVELADALDAAHAAGVLHRDVKPANVLVGRNDRLFLADFGIAKMLESQSGLTATGVVVGTPIYMAPEQALGRPATPATDRYALAVVATIGSVFFGAAVGAGEATRGTLSRAGRCEATHQAPASAASTTRPHVGEAHGRRRGRRRPRRRARRSAQACEGGRRRDPRGQQCRHGVREGAARGRPRGRVLREGLREHRVEAGGQAADAGRERRQRARHVLVHERKRPR